MSLFRSLLFLLFTAWPAWAAEPAQDMQLLRQLCNTWLEQQAASTWPGVQARARAGVVDERLRLPACRDIQFSLPVGARMGLTGSVNAQCAAPVKWSLYLGFQMRLSGPALIARRDLPARAILGATDLETREIDYGQPPSAYPGDPRLVVGARLDRRVAAGQPILGEWLSRPPAILAGQRVRIVVQGPGFSVNQEGNALNNAAAGEAVRVKIKTGRVVHGLAREDGSVQVRP